MEEIKLVIDLESLFDPIEDDSYYITHGKDIAKITRQFVEGETNECYGMGRVTVKCGKDEE